MNPQSQKCLPRFTMYFTFLIDLMGYFIVLPIFAPLLFSSVSPWQAMYGYELRCFFFAFLIFVYAFAQWIGQPFFSSLTFTKGNKAILISTLSFGILAYVMTAFGVVHQHLPLLFFGRILAGFSAGYSPLISSWFFAKEISKIKVAHSHFWPLLIGGFGLLVGPVLVGILADTSIHELFFNALPFWIMSLLLLVNLALVAFLKEGKSDLVSFQFREFGKEFNYFFSFWKNLKTRRPCSSLFFYFLGWFAFIQFTSAFLLLQFHFSESAIGFSFGLMGLSWCCILFLEQRFFPTSLDISKILPWLLFLASLLSFFAILFHNWIFFLIIAWFLCSIFAIIWTRLGFFFKGQANEKNAESVTQFIHFCVAFSAMTASLLSGLVLMLDAQWLYVLTGVCFLLSAASIKTLSKN